MNNANKAAWVTAASMVAVVVAGGLIWLSWGYGEVSQSGYEHAMALVSACNRQDTVRLEKIVASIHQAVESQTLPAYDAKILLRIAERALDGDWEWSSRQVRQVMLDQIQ